MAEGVKRCALYTRVSSRNQLDGNYNSLETQREKLEAYVKSQPNFEVFKVYEDGGFSGEGLQRPGIQSMLQDIAQGKIDCVLSYKIDRLTRKPRDFYTLTEFFEKNRVNFISVTQHFDTSSAMGRLLRNIMMDFAQFEREMTGERTRDKMHQRAEKGYWNGGIVPFGYMSHDKKLVPHPEESGIVRFMFEIFAATGSLARVKEELKLRGYTTRNGDSWGKTSIDNIVRNPVYAGKIRYKENVFPAHHKPLITDKVFSKSQSIPRTVTHVSTRMKRLFLLRGLLNCSDCGSMMTPHYTKKKTRLGFQIYFYYRCSKTLHHNNSICSIRQIGADQIEEIVLNDIGRLISESPILVSAIESANSERAPNIEAYKSELLELRKRIGKLDQEADRYVTALGQGKFSVSRLEKALEKIELQRTELETRCSGIDDRINAADIQEFDHRLIQENLRRFQDTFSTLTEQEKPECLGLILKDVTLGKDTVQLNIFDLPEFNYLESSKNRSERLPR
jgi:DNA invertase Pin-like site-specific DNA recombinase